MSRSSLFAAGQCQVRLARFAARQFSLQFCRSGAGWPGAKGRHACAQNKRKHTVMNVTGFNQDQKQALLDLLILGMYADHKLTSNKDARIDQLVDSFTFPSDYERDQFSDAAFTRV